MENAEPTPVSSNNYRLTYHGSGGDYFGIIIINWLLTAITLGLYYPWAKARKLQYLYGVTDLNESRFSFHGTGAEMFKGFIKAVLIFVILFVILFFFIWMQMPIIGLIVFYCGLFSLFPLAIHGSYKYRMSRSSWRGIRFGYRGDRADFFKLFFKWIFFTIITLGIYGAWMSINIRNYVLSRVRFGNLEFRYKGNGGDYFILILKGYFLTIITLGIYSFLWYKSLFDYYVNNLSLYDNERKVQFRSTATGGQIFGLLIANIFILIFTLGLGYAWVVTRTLNYIISHIQLNGDIDLDQIVQTEGNYTDATGEDVGDMLDFGFVI
ncbi:MAG: YjgN family protein [Bacteroidota bacterium]